MKKTLYRRVAQKNYNFAPGAANHTFLTHPVYLPSFAPTSFNFLKFHHKKKQENTQQYFVFLFEMYGYESIE